MSPDEDDLGESPADQPNAAEPKQVRKRRVTQKMRERDDARFIQDILKDEAGRRFLWAILTAAHTFEERFACGPNGFPQTEATWFHAGEQALGLRLYQTWLRTDPLAVAAMHRENDPRFA
jgi:hypothetical protein